MKNKTLPISQLGCLLNKSRNSHNKHAATGYSNKIARFRKDPMVHEQEYLCYTKI